MQLVAKGAQDQLVNGSPSYTHFRSVYKRHTDFAMEHFRLTFKTTNLSIPANNSLTLRAKIDRNAQLLNDCYLSLTLPNVFSPVVPLTTLNLHGGTPSSSSPTIFNGGSPSGSGPTVLNGGTSSASIPASNAIGYEFQWIQNIGYNMINYVSIVINGQEIVRHTGEWMKLHSALDFNGTKKLVLDQLVGNVPDMYDPANAWDRTNQYPHSISTATSLAEPSISGRVLTIPFHFWFCEDVGSALPLIALQYSEVEFVIELKNMYQLFTIIDVDQTSPTFGTRITPNPSNSLYTMSNFLSPPTYSTNPVPTNPSLTLWNTNAFIECNYIFLNDAELIHIAKTDHSFIIKQLDIVSTFGQYGPSNDLELTLRNLCTRIVWVAQRSDVALQNQYDNYTNWENPRRPPLSSSGPGMTPWYSSGNALSTSVSQRDILLETSIILDGAERFNYKQTEFFSHIQNYRHQFGLSNVEFPGLYTYSFALEHIKTQPSGHINGSMFNKTVLRNSYIQPPLVPGTAGITQVCVLKSTALSNNPTIVVNPNALGANGKPLYNPDDLVTIVNKTDGQTLQYTYNVRAFTESYNFLRVLGGVANVVFSS